MLSPSFLILYVKDIRKSIEFYGSVLESAPNHQSPGFAIFDLGNGWQFGLWLAGVVEPEAETSGGGAEYCIALADEAALNRSFEASKTAGYPVIQTPTAMDFGLTYVIEDPDRHRIRYYVPARP